MKFFSQKMLVFASIFFLVNIVIKKLMFQEQISNELITPSVIVAVIVSLVYYFLNRKKLTSKDK